MRKPTHTWPPGGMWLSSETVCWNLFIFHRSWIFQGELALNMSFSTYRLHFHSSILLLLIQDHLLSEFRCQRIGVSHSCLDCLKKLSALSLATYSTLHPAQAFITSSPLLILIP